MLFNKDVNQCEWEAGGAGDNACRYTAQCLCSTSLSLITPDIMSEDGRWHLTASMFEGRGFSLCNDFVATALLLPCLKSLSGCTSKEFNIKLSITAVFPVLRFNFLFFFFFLLSHERLCAGADLLAPVKTSLLIWRKDWLRWTRFKAPGRHIYPICLIVPWCTFSMAGPSGK